MDISALSVAELKSLLHQIPAEIQRREKQEKTRICQELEALAAKSGYTLDELLGEAGQQARKVSKQVAVKYRHPHSQRIGLDRALSSAEMGCRVSCCRWLSRPIVSLTASTP